MIIFPITLLLNMRSVLVENMPLITNRFNPIMYTIRSHISTINIELKELNLIVNAISPNNKTVSFIGNYDDLLGSDKDRVENNRILEIFNEFQIIGCPYKFPINYENSLDCQKGLQNLQPDYIFVYNGYIFSNNKYKNILNNTIFSVYEKNKI